MQNPRNLRVSAVADELADVIYDYADGFPRDERFGLIAQMRRAAVSVGSNIYEGCAVQTNRGLRAFLYHANGSTAELVFQTRFAIRRRYGDRALGNAALKKLNQMRRMLSRLIRYHERNDEEKE